MSVHTVLAKLLLATRSSPLGGLMCSEVRTPGSR